MLPLFLVTGVGVSYAEAIVDQPHAAPSNLVILGG